jgi:predicted nucleotidyltransferase component of viral defense system
MKPLRTRLRTAASNLRVAQPVVEKDYALSYLLATLAGEPALRETLVFKGGTALKKLYFGEYRFSEDLDFTAQGAPRLHELEEAMRKNPVRRFLPGNPQTHRRTESAP